MVTNLMFDAVERFLCDATRKIQTSTKAPKVGDVLKIKFINKLHLSDSYRKSLVVRDFEFGRVNLLKGVNGAGKTRVPLKQLS